MDTSDKIMFVILGVVATFFTAFQFINWEYKDSIVTGIGVILFLFIFWAFASEVSRRYKVVKVD